MLRELTTFLAVHKDGTFSRAGERIGLTQSAVSAQIRKLEIDLDAELFVRGQRHAALTDAGRRLVPLAEQLLALAAELPRHLRGDAPGGRLKIGAIASVQAGLLPDALEQYRQRYPAVDLHIAPGVSTHLLERVDAGELDLALLVRPPLALPSELRWQVLWREPYVLVVPETVAPADIRTLLSIHPFIRYDRMAYGGRLVQAFLARQRITVQDSMELDDLEAIICMVERGLGVALIPLAPRMRLDGRKLQVMPLGKETFHREIGMVAAAGRSGDTVCNSFMETLAWAAAQGMALAPASRPVSPQAA